MAPSDIRPDAPRNVVPMPVPSRLPPPRNLPDRGFTQEQWRVLVDVTFPTAKSAESVLMAIDYCRARNLDIFKKPIHIVPMWSAAKKAYVETIWPGINEIQITAARTGSWAGMDSPKWGPTITRAFSGTRRDGGRVNVEVAFPEWCEVTVYRMVGGHPRAFCEPVYWLEAYSTTGGRDSELPTDMWLKRPRGQLHKVAKAASLRAAFPEEGEYTAEEMEGKEIEAGGVAIEGTVAELRGGSPKMSADDAARFKRDLDGKVADAADLDALRDLLRENTSRLKDMKEIFPNVYADIVEGLFAKRKQELLDQLEAPAEPSDDRAGTGETASGRTDPDPLPERPRTVEVPVAPDGEPAWGVFADHLLDIIPRVRSRRWGEAFLDLHKGQLARLGAVRGIVGTFDGREMSGTTVAAAIRGRMQIHLDAIDPPRAPDVAAE